MDIRAGAMITFKGLSAKYNGRFCGVDKALMEYRRHLSGCSMQQLCGDLIMSRGKEYLGRGGPFRSSLMGPRVP